MINIEPLNWFQFIDPWKRVKHNLSTTAGQLFSKDKLSYA